MGACAPKRRCCCSLTKNRISTAAGQWRSTSSVPFPDRRRRGAGPRGWRPRAPWPPRPCRPGAGCAPKKSGMRWRGGPWLRQRGCSPRGAPRGGPCFSFGSKVYAALSLLNMHVWLLKAPRRPEFVCARALRALPLASLGQPGRGWTSRCEEKRRHRHIASLT